MFRFLFLFFVVVPNVQGTKVWSQFGRIVGKQTRENMMRPSGKILVMAILGIMVMTMIGWAESGVESMPSAAASAVTAAPATPVAPLRIDTGDTAWVLICTALVMLMTPGLAFFYGGLVRRKNVLSILMQCFVVLCLISLQWVLIGYTLAFSPTKGGLIGGLQWLGLRGVGQLSNPDYAATIPALCFMMFQAAFAIVTPSLIVGAFVERIRFSSLFFARACTA